VDADVMTRFCGPGASPPAFALKRNEDGAAEIRGWIVRRNERFNVV
jgi:hypothetical protein